jgi:folate-binding protein YgfZ
VRAALHSAGAVTLSESSLELARIMGGMPAWGAELTDSVLPPEVGLDRTAVSGRKGCYIGQETMARIATYGHVNRILVAVREDAATAGRPVLPLALVSPSDGAAKGELTSWALHPALGGVGLAIVRRQAAEVDSVLQGGGRRLRVVRLIAG